MSFEFIEQESPAAENTSEETRLSSFQNPIWTEMYNDIGPKIRFTTDREEYEENQKADRSDPFNLPDRLFYIEPKSDAGTDEQKAAASDIPKFTNDSFNIDFTEIPKEAPSESGEYCGPSPDMLNLRIENDVKHLTFCQEQLDRAIESGTGVMSAMRNVESAQKLLDAHMKLYNEAIAFRPPTVAASAENTGSQESIENTALGSVSHAKWQLEQAYKSGNKIAIENAKRRLAHEQAEEDAKKMR